MKPQRYPKRPHRFKLSETNVATPDTTAHVLGDHDKHGEELLLWHPRRHAWMIGRWHDGGSGPLAVSFWVYKGMPYRLCRKYQPTWGAELPRPPTGAPL